MKQLVQNIKSGKIKLVELPMPICGPKEIIVQSEFSLISAGTEGGKVATAKKGYIGKAMEKPDQVKQVLESWSQDGWQTTYMKVMNKLDSPAPLGYSLAGRVLAVGEQVGDFSVGDLAACGGAEAGHAEVVVVPAMLCVKLPAGVTTKQACFTTIAAIALQGIRRAELSMGASCAVIGLGLIGQLTCMMLDAAGVRVVGIDVDHAKVDHAGKHIRGIYLDRADAGLEQRSAAYAAASGVDAVIITAGSKSLDPVELAGRLCRKKGNVVIVGAVPTGFSRETFYKKELDLRMSTSYGPGRYDDAYEQKGVDYPYAYVRWTENRNMQAFLNLLAEQRIDVEHLMTHVFPFSAAEKAYDLILKNKVPFLGVLLQYPHETDQQPIWNNVAASASGAGLGVSFIGAGTFAQKYLLPPIAKDKEVTLNGVVTRDAITARHIAEKYRFRFAAADAGRIWEDQATGTVFIATRHDSHAALVIDALRNRRNVFVEKPLARTLTELKEIYAVCQEQIAAANQEPRLMVGYNRRFAPHVKMLKPLLTNGQPKMMIYRINAGAIPADHWIQDREIGGGRIVGEVCHFVDLLSFLAGAEIKTVSAQALPDAGMLHDNVQITLSFYDGSCGSICYHANGDKKLAKEYLEVHQSGCSYVIDDFKELRLYRAGKREAHRLHAWDKGHHDEVVSFLNSLRAGASNLISLRSLLTTSLVTFLIEECLKTPGAKTVSLNDLEK